MTQGTRGRPRRRGDESKRLAEQNELRRALQEEVRIEKEERERRIEAKREGEASSSSSRDKSGRN